MTDDFETADFATGRCIAELAGVVGTGESSGGANVGKN